MSAHLDKNYKIIKGSDGKEKIIKDEKAAEAKLDLCTRLKRRNSKKVRVAPKQKGK